MFDFARLGVGLIFVVHDHGRRHSTQLAFGPLQVFNRAVHLVVGGELVTRCRTHATIAGGVQNPRIVSFRSTLLNGCLRVRWRLIGERAWNAACRWRGPLGDDALLTANGTGTRRGVLAKGLLRARQLVEIHVQGHLCLDIAFASDGLENGRNALGECCLHLLHVLQLRLVDAGRGPIGIGR